MKSSSENITTAQLILPKFLDLFYVFGIQLLNLLSKVFLYLPKQCQRFWTINKVDGTSSLSKSSCSSNSEYQSWSVEEELYLLKMNVGKYALPDLNSELIHFTV